jgi:hypothetical protein
MTNPTRLIPPKPQKSPEKILDDTHSMVKTLLVLTIANVLMLLYDTDFIYKIESTIHALGG